MRSAECGITNVERGANKYRERKRANIVSKTNKHRERKRANIVSETNKHRERKRANIAGEAGYTLVETLTALVLLMIVFLPLTRIISGLLTGKHNRACITAIDLAEQEMAITLLQREPQPQVRSEVIGTRRYTIERRVVREKSLKKIIVRVGSDPSRPPLAEFYIYQVDYDPADP